MHNRRELELAFDAIAHVSIKCDLDLGFSFFTMNWDRNSSGNIGSGQTA